MFIRIRQKDFGRYIHYIWLNLDHIVSVDCFYKNGEASYMLTDIKNKHYDIICDSDAKAVLKYLHDNKIGVK